MYTPEDYFAEGRTELPSPDHLNSIGKRVVFTSAQFFPEPANQTIFYKYGPLFAGWTEFSPNQFNPDCFAFDSNTKYPTDAGQILRIVDEGITVGPFYGPSPSDRLGYNEIAQTAQCNLNYPSIDQANPVLFAQNVWSWEVNQPST
jgi:hypothetical protein